MEKKKKLIELIIDETADFFGVDAISVVKFPAIEENFVFFNQDFLSLAKIDEEKKQLVGAVLIPEKRIPRLDKETNEEYDVFFTKETIKELVDRLTTIENEIKLLQEDKKTLISDFSSRIDTKAFRAAWSTMKAKKRVDPGEFDNILDELEKHTSVDL